MVVVGGGGRVKVRAVEGRETRTFVGMPRTCTTISLPALAGRSPVVRGKAVHASTSDNCAAVYQCTPMTVFGLLLIHKLMHLPMTDWTPMTSVSMPGQSSWMMGAGSASVATTPHNANSSGSEKCRITAMCPGSASERQIHVGEQSEMWKRGAVRAWYLYQEIACVNKRPPK